MPDEPTAPLPPEVSSPAETEPPAPTPPRPEELRVPTVSGGALRPRQSRERKERPERGPRPDLSATRQALSRETRGYTMRLEPPDLAKLKELPGAKGKSEAELGEEFLATYGERFAVALAEDVSSPAEVRVVVDPYSRQVFLAVANKITAILSF